MSQPNSYVVSTLDGNLTFEIQPFTVNGPTDPVTDDVYSNPNRPDINAFNADTSLVFVGKGVPSYGEIDRQNTLYMLSNFAGSTSPVNPINGQLWFDDSTKILKVWNTADSQWDEVSGVSQQYGDATYLKKSGGTMTGALSVIPPAAATHAASKQYVDSLVGGNNIPFTNLTDTPSSYTGHANKVVTVTAVENGVEFVDRLQVRDEEQLAVTSGSTSVTTAETFTSDTYIRLYFDGVRQRSTQFTPTPPNTISFPALPANTDIFIEYND